MSELGGRGRGRRRNKPAESRFVTGFTYPLVAAGGADPCIYLQLAFDDVLDCLTVP